ncbi:ROK family protein [Thermatribacter velox]|uniref:ROK family protein n=1 Tax=Thermatribacter velox TaxID=3039681 RepID=A0ABZ2YA34_9BACT
MSFFVGIDVGGTKIAGILIDRNLRTYSFLKVSIDGEKDPKKVVEKIALLKDSLVRALPKAKEVSAIGIVIPGVLDINEGVVVESANLGWKNVRIKEMIEERLGLKSYLEHDVRAGAIAELHFGMGEKFTSFLYVSVGTGIAATFVHDRKVVRGANGISGEIGHTTVHPCGPECRCGRKGCLEALSSGIAMERDVFYLVGKRIKGEIIMEEAKKGMYPFLNVVKSAAFYLGVALANLTKIFDPEAIILGGGVSESGEFWLKLVEESYLSNLFERNKATRLFLGKFKSRASVVGAALLPLVVGSKDE